MNKATEKRLLQIAVALACVVPIGGGLLGVIHGAEMVRPGRDITLDSHVRYLSGLLLGIGVCFLLCIRDIERQGRRFSLLAAIVVIGGLARLYGVLIDGQPASPMLFALVMEVIVVPILWLWQYRLQHLFSKN